MFVAFADTQGSSMQAPQYSSICTWGYTRGLVSSKTPVYCLILLKGPVYIGFPTTQVICICGYPSKQLLQMDVTDSHCGELLQSVVVDSHSCGWLLHVVILVVDNLIEHKQNVAGGNSHSSSN